MEAIKTIKAAKEYLKMYFEFNTELRTVMNDDTNIVTESDLGKYTNDQIIIMAQEAQYDIRQQIGYLF